MSNKNPENLARVLFIGPYPPPYSGPELGMRLFLKSSLKDQFQIKFIRTNAHRNSNGAGRLRLNKIWVFFSFILKLLYHLVLFRPHLVYYPVTATELGWLGRDIWCLTISKLFHVKIIIHIRSGHFRLNRQSFRPITRSLIKLSCRFVTLALVQAKCLKTEFGDLIPMEKIKVLYNAIDTSTYTNEDYIDYDPNLLLFMGPINKAKGYVDAVRAIPIVAKRFPEVLFCFAGTFISGGLTNVLYNQIDGSPLVYEDPLQVHEEITAGEYNANYKYLGVISGDEKMTMLRKTNIFLLPSYSEGFSRAVLEAVVMGKAVITTPVGAQREILKDNVNGFLVPPGDHVLLAEKIIQLLSNEELRNRMAKYNYTRARNKFDITIIADQLRSYFNETLEA